MNKKVALVKFENGLFGVRREYLKEERYGFLFLRKRVVHDRYEFASPKSDYSTVADYWWSDRSAVERFAHLKEPVARGIYEGLRRPFDLGEVLEESDYYG